MHRPCPVCLPLQPCTALPRPPLHRTTLAPPFTRSHTGGARARSAVPAAPHGRRGVPAAWPDAAPAPVLGPRWGALVAQVTRFAPWSKHGHTVTPSHLPSPAPPLPSFRSSSLPSLLPFSCNAEAGLPSGPAFPPKPCRSASAPAPPPPPSGPLTALLPCLLLSFPGLRLQTTPAGPSSTQAALPSSTWLVTPCPPPQLLRRELPPVAAPLSVAPLRRRTEQHRRRGSAPGTWPRARWWRAPGAAAAWRTSSGAARWRCASTLACAGPSSEQHDVCRPGSIDDMKHLCIHNLPPSHCSTLVYSARRASTLPPSSLPPFPPSSAAPSYTFPPCPLRLVVISL